MKLLLIGKKGCGKSSLLYTLFDGCNIGGVICISVFEKGERIGKDAVNMVDGKRCLFCRITNMANFKGVKTQEYVISKDGIRFCINALEKAMEKDSIIIDEFGPLEMKEKGVYETAKKIIESEKNVVIVLRKNLEEKFLRKFPYKFEKVYIG